MNTHFFKKSNVLIFFLFCAMLFCFVCAHLFVINTNAFAEQKAVSINEFLPQSDLENYELNSPIDAYAKNGVTAITQNNQQLLLYNDGWQAPISGFNAIKQVNMLDDSTLLVSDDGTIYQFNLSQLNAPRTALETTSGNIVGGNFFDINASYLVTAYSSIGTIYEMTQDGYAKKANFTTMDMSPIAINDNNNIFFVNADGLAKYDVELKSYVMFKDGISPSKMIANEQFLYYILNGDIYRVPVDGGNEVKLEVSTIDAAYDLGTLESPTGISFKGENLLIIDGNTIQEYSVAENELLFTGFAIAKDYTAYNRISATATLIEKAGNSVAVLDDFKFTMFTKNNENVYDRANYINVLSDKLLINGVYPTDFAYDNNTALFLYNSGSANCFVKKLNILSGENSDLENLTENNKIRDIAYQSGFFYVLIDIGNDNSKVYALSSTCTAITDNELIFTTTNSRSYNQIAVDTYGNLVLATNTTISVFNKADNYALSLDKTALTKITKIQTDLIGRIFFLDNGTLSYVNQTEIDTYLVPNVKNFALDFVDSNAYILNNDSEFISCTTGLDNVSINALTIPNSFTFTNPTGVIDANENLQFFTCKTGANAYKVKNKEFVSGENFEFASLKNYSGEYVLICSVYYGNTTEFYVLANQTDIVLIEKSQAQSITLQKTTSLPEKAFVATDVNAYYLPILTAQDSFVMNNGTDTIRLNKLTEIKLIYKINFLEYDYYYAEFSAEGLTRKAYIPCDYTVLVLTEDLAFDEYRLEKVNQTAVYSDESMATVQTTLTQNTQVRVIAKVGSVYKIAYKTQSGEYQLGYISVDNVIDEPALAIRNVLIIIVIVACVCATSIYFIVRKKKHD